jgi:hypothetical protein
LSARQVLVIGSGKRACSTALPAFHRAPEGFAVRAVFARRAKEIEVDGHAYAVRAVDELDAAALAGIDLVYCAVAKDAVPGVLARLLTLGASRFDLLLDTPVVRIKHFRHSSKLDAFRNALVAEDCVHLPWIEPVRRAVAAGSIGTLAGVLFQRSAYAYHGIATAKAVLGATRVSGARRVKIGNGLARRTLRLRGTAAEAWIVEPRDYSAGSVCVLGDAGSIADCEQDGPGVHLPLAPVLAAGEVTALRIGDEVFPFDAAERELLRGDPPELGLTARMDAQKRVGFLRLLRAIAAGRGAYPVDAALEDAVVDAYLERLNRYRATALTDPREPAARALLRVLTRVTG